MTASPSTASCRASSRRQAAATTASTTRAASASRPTRCARSLPPSARSPSLTPALLSLQRLKFNRRGLVAMAADPTTKSNSSQCVHLALAPARRLTDPFPSLQVLLHARRDARAAEQAHPLRARHGRLALQPAQAVGRRARARVRRQARVRADDQERRGARRPVRRLGRPDPAEDHGRRAQGAGEGQARDEG